MEKIMAKIDLSNISHTYNPNDANPTYALNPFSMTWENGNRYAILGPSGCGKTTMLNIVSGLVRPSGGNILFDSYDSEKKLVKVILQGACSGCPSSTITLKKGIENMLKEMLQGQVETVEAING